MTHYGDITKLNGAKLPAVDVITGGSPCQDLSIAGNRAGLAGARSGLFMEQIRLIKEMRQHDRDSGRTGKLIRPRYMVWENVPGAFSSNGGEDFRAVLEETAHIADESAVIPEPPKGRWTTSGAIVGDGWSIAWRVLDAQFWGVPQRRRRIALVADFGGLTAGEILFERKGLSRNTAESGETGKETAGDAESGVGNAECLTPWDCQSKRIFSPDGQCPTLQGGIGGGVNNPAIFTPYGAEVWGFSYKASPRAGSIGYAEEQAPTILGERQDASIFDARRNGDGSTAPVMTGDHNGHISDYTSLVTYQCQGLGDEKQSETGKSLMRCDDITTGDLVAAVDCRNNRETGETFGTLQAKENGGQSLNYMGAVRTGCSVRRLTPLECERLQGYPDGWTLIGEPKTRKAEIKDEDTGEVISTIDETVMTYIGSDGKKKKCSDSARYKALGNSIALPPWRWVLLRIAAQYERPATLGSLFDGIGGFPLIWERLNGAGSCLWASEIEEFCIAVTKMRFGAGMSERSAEDER